MGSSMLIIYVVAFIAIFYFMAIRPQQKQRKAHQALLSSLKKGDRIVTAAGMYGTIKRVEENMVVVEVAKGVSIKMARRAIAEIISDKAQIRAVAPEKTTGRGKDDDVELEEPSAVEELEAGEAPALEEGEVALELEAEPAEETGEAAGEQADTSGKAKK